MVLLIVGLIVAVLVSPALGLALVLIGAVLLLLGR